MAGGDQAVDQGFVVGGEVVGEGAEVVVPLRLGAWAADGGGNQAVVEHPGEGELAGGDALGFGVGGELLGDGEAFRAPFGFHHAAVLAAGAGVGGWRGIGVVFAGEHAAGEWRIGHDAEAEIVARGQVFDFDLAVEGVVERLAGNGTVDAGLVAQRADFGDAPGAVVGDAEITDFAGAYQVGQRVDGLGEWRGVVFLVQVQQVDRFGAEAAQAGLDGRGLCGGATGRARWGRRRWGWRIWWRAPTIRGRCRWRGRRLLPSGRRCSRRRCR